MAEIICRPVTCRESCLLSSLQGVLSTDLQSSSDRSDQMPCSNISTVEVQVCKNGGAIGCF